MNTIDYNSVFYVKRNGKVIACKFESLNFWYNSTAWSSLHETFNSCRVSYWLTLADGSHESGYHCGFPNVSATIDDCLNGVYVERPPKYLTPEMLAETIGFVPETKDSKVICGPAYKYYEAWMWNGYEPVLKPIGSMDGGACRSECWYNALTRTFENRKWYATRELCARDNAIEVINF